MVQEQALEFIWEFEAIGTQWSIGIADNQGHDIEALKERITDRIEEFDQAYSRFRNDSLVYKMSVRAGVYELPADAKPLFDISYNLYRATGGVFTPLIGQVLVDAGYDAEYSLTPRALVQPPAWETVLQYDFPHLTLKEPALLDFGAAGKGYLVDIVAHLLEEEGIADYVINAGGDLRVHAEGEAPVRVGLEHPDDPTQVIGIAELTTGSICGSAGNRRAWRGFTHLMNPKTLRPADAAKAVWVTATEARVADAVSTCLFFISPSQLKERIGSLYSFEHLVVYSDYTFDRSPHFPAELFIESMP